MALTQNQKSIIAKAKSLGGGEQGVALSDEICTYLVGVIAQDLALLSNFPELPTELPPFFGDISPNELAICGIDFYNIFERLITLDANSDTYFACLAALHKGRLKYGKILETQPIPTVEQVGPRSLLQYGQLSTNALAGLLFWRKWFYDIDNRAAQETGYVFEPIIAYAIGGTPVGSKRSPVKRHGQPTKGRQVDCIRDKRAYEFKMRVTIAASGQGRWGEELDFPIDCKASGYTPVLIVLDATPNPKLEALKAAFEEQGGEAYAGASAWEHLDAVAGSTMALFLERYIRTPLQSLLATQLGCLPPFSATMRDKHIALTLGDETLIIDRTQPEAAEEPQSEMPEDADDFLSGV